jgi:hypothetical protein
MNDLSEMLTIRCSPADRETIDRLREDRSRGAFLRMLVRRADAEAAPCA